MRRLDRGDRRGATIIEIVAAIVILGIALPPLMMAFADAATQTIHPSLATIASYLANERMEEIVARRYRGTDGYDAVTTANFPNEAPVIGFPRFNRMVTVTYTDDALNTVGSDEGYRLVRVTVSWNGGANTVLIERVFADAWAE